MNIGRCKNNFDSKKDKYNNLYYIYYKMSITEPINLQNQIYEILTNNDKYAVLLDKEELKFMYDIISKHPDILDEIIASTQEYFFNGIVYCHNIPSIVYGVSNVYSSLCDIPSRTFLMDITRFTIDCLLNYKVYNMNVHDMTKIEKAIDNSVRLLIVNPIKNSSVSKDWCWFFIFCA